MHIVENRNKSVKRTYCYACECLWDKKEKKYVKKGISVGRLEEKEDDSPRFVPNKKLEGLLQRYYRIQTNDDDDSKSINDDTMNIIVETVFKKYGEDKVTSYLRPRKEAIIREFINAKSPQEKSNIAGQYEVSTTTINRWYHEFLAEKHHQHINVGKLIKIFLDGGFLTQKDLLAYFDASELSRIRQNGYVTISKHIELIRKDAEFLATLIVVNRESREKEAGKEISASTFQSLVQEIFDKLEDSATGKGKKQGEWEERSVEQSKDKARNVIAGLIGDYCKLETKGCEHLCYAQTEQKKWNTIINQIKTIVQKYPTYFYVSNLPIEPDEETRMRYFIEKVIPADAQEHHLYVHYTEMEKTPEIDAFFIVAKADAAAEILWMADVFCCDSRVLMTETLNLDTLYHFLEKELFADETILKIVSKRGLNRDKKTPVSNFSTFYRKFGFKSKGTLRDYWGKGHDAYVWMKWKPQLLGDFTSPS